MPCNAVMAVDGAKHKPSLISGNFQPMLQSTHRATLSICVRDEHRAAMSFLIGLAAWQENLYPVGQVSQVFSAQPWLRPPHSRGKPNQQQCTVACRFYRHLLRSIITSAASRSSLTNGCTCRCLVPNAYVRANSAPAAHPAPRCRGVARTRRATRGGRRGRPHLRWLTRAAKARFIGAAQRQHDLEAFRRVASAQRAHGWRWQAWRLLPQDVVAPGVPFSRALARAPTALAHAHSGPKAVRCQLPRITKSVIIDCAPVRPCNRPAAQDAVSTLSWRLKGLASGFGWATLLPAAH